MAVECYELLDVRKKRPKMYPGKPMEEVIWLNKTAVYNATSKKNKKKRCPADAPLPSAMKMYNPDIPPGFRQALESIFAKGSVCDTDADWCFRYPEVLTALIKKPEYGKERHMSVTAATAFLKQRGMAAAAAAIRKLFRDVLAGMFNVRPRADAELLKRLEDESNVSVIKYVKPVPSLHCHVDNVSGGRGPVVTVNIGPMVYYDLIPVFFTERENSERKPVRVRVDSGTAVAMDGEMRYAWQHCIPAGYATRDVVTKYTVKFVMPAFGKNKTSDRLAFFRTSVPVSMN